MITGLAHVNLTVPEGTLEQAASFYGETLGLKQRPVPALQKGTIAWYRRSDELLMRQRVIIYDFTGLILVLRDSKYTLVGQHSNTVRRLD